MTDIRIEKSHGLAILYAETESAEDWLEMELGDCTGLDRSWPVEEEYLADLVRCAEGDGLAVLYT